MFSDYHNFSIPLDVSAHFRSLRTCQFAECALILEMLTSRHFKAVFR